MQTKVWSWRLQYNVGTTWEGGELNLCRVRKGKHVFRCDFTLAALSAIAFERSGQQWRIKEAGSTQ